MSPTQDPESNLLSFLFSCQVTLISSGDYVKYISGRSLFSLPEKEEEEGRRRLRKREGGRGGKVNSCVNI